MRKLDVKAWSKLFFISIWLMVVTVSCSKSDPAPDTLGPPSPPPTIKDGVFEKRGENSFVYTKYVPLESKPVTVFYYIPTSGNIVNMPVLFSFHGAERDGTIQRDAWKYFAEKHGFIVIAPQFSKDHYSENQYQFGGVFTTSAATVLNPKEKWTYNIVEALFDYFKAETGNASTTYNMFGHSAGGQFVHRYLIAMPHARVNRAVAANPGSWTFPYVDGIVGIDNKTYGWPYSIRNTPFTTQESLRTFFSRRLYIQLGMLDTNPDASGLPKGAPAMAQGAHRLERGRFFYEESKRLAQKDGADFFFQKAEVANGNHSTLRMVYGRTVSNSNRADVTNVGANNAYSLIFK